MVEPALPKAGHIGLSSRWGGQGRAARYSGSGRPAWQSRTSPACFRSPRCFETAGCETPARAVRARHNRSKRARRVGSARSTRDIWLDELRKLREGLLPTEIAGFDWDRRRQAGLLDVDLRAYGDWLEAYSHMNDAGQIRIVEPVCVADELMRNELEIFSAE